MNKKLPTYFAIITLLILNGTLLTSQTKTIPFQELPDYNGLATGSGIFSAQA